MLPPNRPASGLIASGYTTRKLRMTGFPLLTTKRLLLRSFSVQDTSSYALLLQDPQTFPFITDQGPATTLEVEQKIARILKSYQMHQHIYWALALKGSNTFVGYLAVHNLTEVRVSLSYATITAYRRKGFMAEAIEAVLHHLSDHGTQELEARVHAGNHASACLLKSLGFIRIGFKAKRHIYRLSLGAAAV